jgi:hypothetical protein
MHLHFNNHISSKQDINKFSKDLFDAIVQSGHRSITMSVDDGDGDVWKYDIHIVSNRVPEIQQLNEN